MIYESLYLPRWLESGIKPNHKGARMEKIIVGGDTETVGGKPNSFQFYSEDIAISDIMFVNERNARKTFLKWCSKLKSKVQYVIYFHNLQHDLIELLWGLHERLVENGSEFSFSSDGFDIRGFYGSPTFCTLRKGADVHIILADSFSFYRGSLESAAALYCPELPKLRRPMGLGERRYDGSSTAFVEYAMRDAQVTYHIGRAVEELHNEFDLKQCISVADLAAHVFRHRYLTYTIPQPAHDVVHAGLDAYHGGKNNIAVEPGWYPDTYGIDVSSAYPHAMRNMPAFSNARLYKRYRRGVRVRSVPDYGVYRCTGVAQPCQWPVVFDHAFKPMRGEFSAIWIQGFELNEALRSGEVKLTKIDGWYYDHERDHQAPALRAFCEEFFKRKQHEKDPVKRYGHKSILNAVSGKFIQTRKKTLKTYVDTDSGDVSSAAELVAGGMFHSFIAAAITAHTRARIHRLEHDYRALHTATDGFFTSHKPKRDVCLTTATKLGQLTCDAHGDLLLVRNKLYIMYERTGKKPSKVFPGRFVSKCALHGFQGDVHDLEMMIVSGERTYSVTKPNKLKTSIARGLTPNLFETRQMNLRNVPHLELDV
jgi:hypothetical protein